MAFQGLLVPDCRRVQEVRNLLLGEQGLGFAQDQGRIIGKEAWATAG
jgi:hypothetical protein